MKLPAVLLLTATAVLFAESGPRGTVQQTQTQTLDFSSGGWLRFNHSRGELSIEAWDRPAIEITTIKTTLTEFSAKDHEKGTHELDQVRVSVDHQGQDLVITTRSPRRYGLPSDVDLWYLVKAPKNARLAVAHGSGEVHIDGLTGEMHVTARDGAITLHLPQDGAYHFDARSRFGGVQSDFAGEEKRRFWQLGHRFAPESTSGPTLYLRTGYGDITILKIHTPSGPAAAAR